MKSLYIVRPEIEQLAAVDLWNGADILPDCDFKQQLSYLNLMNYM